VVIAELFEGASVACGERVAIFVEDKGGLVEGQAAGVAEGDDLAGLVGECVEECCERWAGCGGGGIGSGKGDIALRLTGLDALVRASELEGLVARDGEHPGAGVVDCADGSLWCAQEFEEGVLDGVTGEVVVAEDGAGAGMELVVEAMPQLQGCGLVAEAAVQEELAEIGRGRGHSLMSWAMWARIFSWRCL
jgi:hypothetical protein